MGVTYKQGKIMKNIYKSFALLCMGLAATACIEENFENNGPKYDTTPGNEIVFSATAGIENGMPEPETRTVYGDQGTANGKNWIEINWVNDDMIAITSPQSGGPKVGHYKVTGADQDNPETTDKNEADDFNSTHAAASLTRLGDGGLQWSEETKYTFYAAYPSFKYDVDKSHGATATLTEDGVLTGSMPIDQNYTLNGDSANGWVAAPDMRYSFMTASMTDYDRTNKDAAINLEFKSMVTALQFNLIAGAIDTKDPVTEQDVTQMELISISLSSNKNITGGFNYDIKTGRYSGVTGEGTRIASLYFDKTQVMLSSGTSMNVTFFILPEDFTADDELKLQINFKLGSTQMSRIATIRAENIKGGKKHIFNNVTLPSFKEDKIDVSASSWWDTLDPDTILSQVSIPVASNVFANSSYDVNDTYHQQQSISIESLWAMGVRGFEIANQSMVSAWGTANAHGPTWQEVMDGSLDDEPVIAAETELSETFKTSIDKLFRLMWGLDKEATTIPANAKKPTECIILICSYASKNDGYNPYAYVANLFNSLSNFCTRWGVDRNDTFVQITKNSTVGDLAGKIAVIIRPGDDERWLYQDTELKQGSEGFFGIGGSSYSPWTNPYTILGVDSPEGGLTGKIDNNTLSSNWWQNVLLISDWGTASYDVWDRRYGADYTRAAAFNDKAIAINRAVAEANGGKKQYENTLWATTENGVNNITPTKKFNFEHAMSNGATAHIQEWMRVIPEGGISTSVTSGRNTIYIQWPASILEKKAAIKALFDESIGATNGEEGEEGEEGKVEKDLNDLYINVLTGYYATTSHMVSCYPFKEECGNVTLSNQGKGGNFAALASELNQYTYDLLSAEPGTSSGLSKQGPWGLVMMDHIKANDVSADLVELIMMNNFKFPLVTKDGLSKANYNATYSNGGEAISFK